MPRILGIDFGERRIGLAISDPLGLTAQPLDTLMFKTDQQIWNHLDNLIQKYRVEKIVVGLPLHMHGEAGSLAEKVELFAQELRNRFNLEVILWDERLSSKVAEDVLRAVGKQPSRQKAKVDQISALWILQGFLDRLQIEKNRQTGGEDGMRPGPEDGKNDHPE